jgi:transcriptional accessory protein Tex/SPT6
VHVSELADRFVKDPGAVLKVRQTIEVTVLAVDLERKRISLTLKKQPERGGKPVNQPEKREIQENKPVGEETRPKIAPGKPPQERQEHGRPQREKPGHGRPQQGKPRNEKVPFNNPFAAVFGKK